MPFTRREFLKGSLAAMGALALPADSYARAAGSNETIRVAVAGLHGQGGTHVNSYTKMEGVEVAYLVDPDTRTYAKHLKTIEGKGGRAPKTVQDIRRALEDKDLHCVSIATPNHWHSLLTIWACQAGKDVYVEKPMSHEVREGRIAVETARKHDRIVQHGTQSRSGSLGLVIQELARRGTYGKLLVSRGLCYKSRKSIGTKSPKAPPPEVDFNLWLGPAQEEPYHENLVHYNWHWFWSYGNGDIGNQGVHEMDLARWAIPGATLPKSVFSLGGRFGYTDQGQTPNTQVSVFDFGETKLLFEVRGLDTDKYFGQGVGNTYHFEAGVVAGGKFHPKGGGEPQSLPKIETRRGPGSGHFGNFIAAVRSRKREDLNAEILEGHFSAALCHLANISYRLGKPVPFDKERKALGDDREAVEALARMEEHLGKNAVKLEELTYRLGRKIAFDAAAETFTGDPEAAALLTRNCRPPFVVPEKAI
jgi:predicted dehydrogenase